MGNLYIINVIKFIYIKRNDSNFGIPHCLELLNPKNNVIK